MHTSDDLQRLEAFLAIACPQIESTGVSWAGFYLDHPGEPDAQRLHLGPSRGGPACNPIGLHGACGQALTAGKTLVVRDVADLGEGYIACDPRDQSELVVPLLEGRHAVGVLDLDSHQRAAFDTHDAEMAGRLLELAQLSRPA